MGSERLSVVVTRRLPEVVETRMRELFEVELRDPDLRMTREDLVAAIKRADVIVPCLTDQIDANMLAPIELIKATVDGMIARRFGRIVNITSGAVKAPIDVLGLSNGARSGLTGFVAGLARKTVAHNVTINNLLPGFFDTDRIATVIGGQAKARGVPYEQVLADPKTMLKDLEFEALLTIAPEAYERATGEEYDHLSPLSYETFSNREGWRR